MAHRPKTDWKAVEAEFRAGKTSIRQIGERFGVSDTAIRKRAKAENWVRTPANHGPGANLPAREALPAVQTIIPPRPPRPVVTVEPGEAPPSVALGQELAHRLLGELDVATLRQDEIEDAIYEETRDDENGQRRATMLKAVKTLAQAMAALKEVGQGAEKGKKEQRQESAQKAAAGRFAPPAPPKLVVNNGS